jgi:hypothetical protein
MSALKNLQAHTNGARENHIGGKTIGHAYRQNPRKAAVHPSEDKYDQPHTNYA